MPLKRYSIYKLVYCKGKKRKDLMSRLIDLSAGNLDVYVSIRQTRCCWWNINDEDGRQVVILSMNCCLVLFHEMKYVVHQNYLVNEEHEMMVMIVD